MTVTTDETPPLPDEPLTAPAVPGRLHPVLAWLTRLAESLVVPALALVTALAVGAMVIIASNPDTVDLSRQVNVTRLVVGGAAVVVGIVFRRRWFGVPLVLVGMAVMLAMIEAYQALWDTSLGDQAAISRTLVEATPLAFTGLSVALAFRAGLFNIGAAGQLIIGATCAGWVGFTWDLPRAIHVPAAIVAGFLGGALWGYIAGLLKARTGAHEVITTIMLNYVAYYLLDYALRSDSFQRSGRNDPISKPVVGSARLPEVTVADLTLHAGLFLALAAACLVWWLLGRSTVGFRMRTIGANPFAGRYAGMNVGRTYMLAMFLAAGLAGLAGASNILSRDSFSLTPRYYSELGFDGIAVALLGRANPAGVVGASLLFGVLRSGSTGMQVQTSIPVDIIVVIQALIIMFVAAPALVRAIYQVRAGRATEQAFTTNWGA
ncbi:MAG: ABC transporter permease [Acidimicrobiales bacterium]